MLKKKLNTIDKIQSTSKLNKLQETTFNVQSQSHLVPVLAAETETVE